MIEGATIFQAVQFIDLLNKDISRLIGTVDEEMQAKNYKKTLQRLLGQSVDDLY